MRVQPASRICRARRALGGGGAEVVNNPLAAAAATILLHHVPHQTHYNHL